jgi:hypothetical protein
MNAQRSAQRVLPLLEPAENTAHPSLGTSHVLGTLFKTPLKQTLAWRALEYLPDTSSILLSS